jgi:parvulin-like peptidyl-prolyl isomerase
MKRKQSSSAPDKNEHQSPRKTVMYVLTVALLVVVVVAFVGAPALTGFAGGSTRSFGTYKGDEISAFPGNYMSRQYQGLAEQVQENTEQVTAGLVQSIWREAFQRTVRHLAVLDYAEAAGVGISTRGLDRAMSQWPAFRVGGSFDREAYERMDNQSRSQLRDFLEDFVVDQQVRSDLRFPFELRDIASVEQFEFLSNVFADQLFPEPQVSEAELDFLVEIAGPERQFDFVQFAFADFPDEAVIEYAQENARRFERANLSTISITTSENEAEEIRERIANQEATFEDIARTQSTDIYSSDGGDMGIVYFHELEPDFEDPDTVSTIFSLEEGEMSEVLETTFGWSIYRMDEEPIEPDFDDGEVIAEVRNYMSNFERGTIEDYLAERADEFVATAEAQGFAAAASEINELPQQTGYFPINFGNLPYFSRVSAQSNQALAEGASREEFFLELFSLSQDAVSDPIVVRDYIFVFSLAGERAPTTATVSQLQDRGAAVVQAISASDVQRVLVDDEELNDNFRETYNRLIQG